MRDAIAHLARTDHADLFDISHFFIHRNGARSMRACPKITAPAGFCPSTRWS
jgi:hypothetical protein